MVDTARLRELLASATPGPWRDDAVPRDDVVIWGPRVAGDERPCDLVANVGAARASEVAVAFDVDSNNARLIVAAVNALPELLAALDGARLERDEARADRDTLVRYIEDHGGAGPDTLHLVRANNHLADLSAELDAIVALRDLPPGVMAPEHEGEAYTVAVGLKCELDQERSGREIVERQRDAARARVAEIEATNLENIGEANARLNEVRAARDQALRDLHAAREAHAGRSADCLDLACDLSRLRAALRAIPCPRCNGTGVELCAGTDYVDCETCLGTGRHPGARAALEGT